MKTAIKTFIATALTAIVLTSSAFASDNMDNKGKQVTVLSDVKNISKIKVSGNVELILVQSLNESIRVYDNYYAKNALVQQQNGELFISSFDNEKLTVVAYVNNLSAVEATDNADVQTSGKFNLLSLDVKLKSNATANINVNAINLNTNVTGNADLTIEGAAADLYTDIDSVAKLNMVKFSAENTRVNAKNIIPAKTSESFTAAVELGK